MKKLFIEKKIDVTIAKAGSLYLKNDIWQLLEWM